MAVDSISLVYRLGPIQSFERLTYFFFSSLSCSHSFIQSAFVKYVLGTSPKSGNRAMKTTGTDPVLGGNCSPVMEAQHSLRSTTCVRVMKGR